MTDRGKGLRPRGRRLWGVVGRIAAAVMVVGLLSIIGFIVRSRLAHDEQRCPYEAGELRRVSQGVRVREELRRCQPRVEERRWMVLREGEPPRELARRRLRTELFAPERYHWEVKADAAGDLVLEVRNRGTHPIEVHEAKLLEQAP